MPPAPFIVVVQHQDECPPARLGEWLAQAGVQLTIVRPDLGMALPQPDRLDGLIVLGGVMGATDDAIAPWLGEVRELIRGCVRVGTPTLGVCLGHQLIAAALGGRVHRNPNGKQRGLTRIGLTGDAADDALLGGAGHGGAAVEARGVHSNNDVVIELPAGSTPLAIAPGGELQAVRFAAAAWGLQWHPEVDAETFARWCTLDPLADEQRAHELVAEVAGAADELAATWQPVANRFADLCRARADRPARRANGVRAE